MSLSQTLNLFYREQWEDKVDEKVAVYAFQQVDTSSGSVLYLVIGSDRRRKACFKFLKKRTVKEAPPQLNSSACSTRYN